MLMTEGVKDNELEGDLKWSCLCFLVFVWTDRKESVFEGEGSTRLQSALNRRTVRLFTDSDDTRGCNNTICPPEDEQNAARKMLRIVM